MSDKIKSWGIDEKMFDEWKKTSVPYKEKSVEERKKEFIEWFNKEPEVQEHFIVSQWVYDAITASLKLEK